MTSTPHGTKYRPEIDGLRAIAVVAVILYHARLPWFSGGFVGVDVFFVISGYLITQIIVADVQAGRFSVGNFYERRARRILPALFVVLAASLVAAWLWMAPSQLKGFAESLAAVPLFASNFLFNLKTGYFGGAVDQLPLLHTWSLAVEEQFYVVFPLFVLLLWRHGARRFALITAAVALCSLIFSAWQARIYPTANFYLAPSRVWELLIGSLLAVASLRMPLHQRLSQPPRELLAALGMAMIILAVSVYSATTPFPSYYALLPTLGSALLLGFGTPDTVVGRFLALRSMVGIGLVSYSAYLWHVPLFAFARIVAFGELGNGLAAALIGATFILAYLTWKHVETPFRNKKRLARTTVFASGAVGSLLFVAVGCTEFYVDRVDQLSYPTRANFGLGQSCESVDNFAPTPTCRTSAAPKVLVWGDSFGMHIVAGLTGSDSAIALAQATKSACGPFLGLAPVALSGPYGPHWANECLRFNESVIEYARTHSSVETVVMASPFTAYVDSSKYVLTDHGRLPASVPLAAEYMQKTIARLRSAGKRVVIIAPPPAGDFNAGLCVERMRSGKPSLGAPVNCEIEISAYHERYGNVLELLKRVERESPVAVIRFDSLLCNAARCVTSLDGVSIYRDDAHFSYGGIEHLGKRMSLANEVGVLAR